MPSRPSRQDGEGDQTQGNIPQNNNKNSQMCEECVKNKCDNKVWYKKKFGWYKT